MDNMREIKFRAWDTERKKMLSWREEDAGGDYHEWWATDWSVFCHVIPENEIILMQYTGLKGRNDQEIYEGDIVLAYWKGTDKAVDWNETMRIGPKPQVVEFRDCGFSPMIVCDREGEYGYENHDYQILGNIYENPGLMP